MRRRSLFILLPQGRISACCVVQNLMGNFKFRLSDMIPSTWLSKLKHANSMSSSRKALLPSDDDQDRLFRHERLLPTAPRSPLPIDHTHRRKSYYFSREFHAVQPRRPPTPPRRSTSKPRGSGHLRRPTRRSSPRLFNTSVLACCSCRGLARFNLVRVKPRCPVPGLPPDSPSSTDAIFPQSPSSFGHSSGLVPSSESFDKVVSRNNIRSSCRCRANFDGPVMLARGFGRDPLSDLEHPPVLTKSHKFNERVLSSRKGGENKKPVTTNNSRSSSSSSSVFVKVVKEETYNRTVRANHEHKKPRPIVNLASSPAGGVRLRVNSPKVGSRKQSQAHQLGRKSGNAPVSSCPVPSLYPRTGRSSGASDGFAVVKSSADPWKEFRDSMVEMIVENDIRVLKDLEDLLACYLTLNSDEYHGIIIGVFKQILFDFDSAC